MAIVKPTFWEKLWAWINTRKTSIATILSLLGAFALTKGFIDADTLLLINGILAAVGLGVNQYNAAERAKGNY